MNLKKTYLLLLLFCVNSAVSYAQELPSSPEKPYRNFSGIYPHLAMYNSEAECGTGAVVPWAERLWVVTYSPHMPFGSDDKLYEITADLQQHIRPESIGGTPANRMIHKPSEQLFIGPYVIDTMRHVRVLPYTLVPGRPTGVAQHLTDPENRVLLATMEAGFYDIDVHSLDAVTLYKDGNQKRQEGFQGDLCDLFPGYHGKGFYSGQGVAVYSNNGEEGELAQRQFDIPAGSLNEWDGSTWKTVRRSQFTEVTGPGGILGNAHPDTDPLWSLGFDYRSVILAVREPSKGWSYYRLPKASFAYDGAHGWNTEWPRIRNVGTEESPELLMTMHGMFWHFPVGFCSTHTAGIRPRGAYLKVIADFCRWNGQLVFGCDDSAKSEFLNTRRQKGGISGAGQSNSNLWFTSLSQPDRLGPTTAGGSVWLHDSVRSHIPSDPFLFSGWDHRCAWLANHSDSNATITLEVDRQGRGEWEMLRTVPLAAHSSLYVPFSGKEKAVWVRAVSDRDIVADLTFNLTQQERRSTRADKIFQGLADIRERRECSSDALMYDLPDNRRAMGLVSSGRYYELDAAMHLQPRSDTAMLHFIQQKMAIPHDVVQVDSHSILIVDAKGRRWRLPLGDEAYSDAIQHDRLRICREVVTERDLLSLHGTFYELPAENADGFAKIRPISSHHFAISDYASYRGVMVLSGVRRSARGEHIVSSQEGDLSLWAGTIDDLWKMGKPTGHGGPWYQEDVQAEIPSDPFLIGFYDKRTLSLTNHGEEPVSFTLQADPTGDGAWFNYQTIQVAPSKTVRHTFPSSFQARWIRLLSSRHTRATASFEYK